MISIRLAVTVTALAVMTAASAAADPAYVTSTVNLRAGAGTNTEIVAKIPGGSRVEATNCSEWCEVDWQGKKGFAIATSIDRSGRPMQRAQIKLQLDADDTSKSAVPMSTGTYVAPQRYYGPFFWSDGPDYGRYKGYSGFGFRGRW